jgi:membrane protease YdiL (CAAX protease family)
VFRNRKTLYLIIAYVSLIIAVGLVKNPYQYRTVGFAWWWAIGFLSLLYLAYIEKQSRIPFRFIDRLKWKWGYPIQLFGIALGLTIIITSTLARVLGQIGLPPYYFVVQSSNDVFGIIGFDSAIAISEESFKVAFTNLFARVFVVRKKSTGRLIVMFFGTVSIALWAYFHMLIGGHNSSYVTIAFCAGIVYFLITYYAKNYLPTTVAHGVWDMVLDFGFFEWIARFLP